MIGRRAFLALSAGAIGAAVLGCFGGDHPDLAVLFDDEAAAAVAALGGRALEEGAVADAGVAYERLGVTGSDLDEAAFVEGFRAQVASELAAGDLVPVAGYLLTPTEAALAVAVHDARG